MRFKVPMASVVAATTIAAVAGVYALVGSTATLSSLPSSATVTASAAGLKATAAGTAASIATSGEIPSASVELPIPSLPGLPSALPPVAASVPATGASVAVAPGKAAVSTPSGISSITSTSGPAAAGGTPSTPGLNIPGLGDALKRVPAAQLPEVTNILRRAESMNLKDRIFDIKVPTETEVRTRAGKRQEVKNPPPMFGLPIIQIQ